MGTAVMTDVRWGDTEHVPFMDATVVAPAVALVATVAWARIRWNHPFLIPAPPAAVVAVLDTAQTLHASLLLSGRRAAPAHRPAPLRLAVGEVARDGTYRGAAPRDLGVVGVAVGVRMCRRGVVGRGRDGDGKAEF
eukprot:gene7893-biopygen10127